MPRQFVRNFGTCLTSPGTINIYATGGTTSIPACNASMSVSCWFKMKARLTSQTIWSFDDGATHQYTLGLNGSGTLQIGKWGGTALVSAPTLPQLGVWHHAVYTYNGTTHRLYIDGVEVANAGTATTSGTPSSLTFFDYSGHNQGFNGSIDDFRTYTARVLSAAEVSSLYYGFNPTTTGLVFWYGFDEGSGTTLVDSSGTGNTGTISGPTYSTDVFTIPRTIIPTYNIGSALQFNGSTQYGVKVGSVTAVNDNFTMSCWAYINALPSAAATFVTNGNTAANGYSLEITNTGLLRTEYHFVAFYNSGSTLSTLTWYHLLLVRRNGTSQHYVNGVASGSTSSSTPNAPNTNTGIGNSFSSSQAAGSNYFSGILDDVRIYARALDVQEIKDLANMLPVSSNSLKGWWKLDDGSGTSATDSSGNVNTLSLANTPTWVTPGHVLNAGRVPINTTRTLTGTRTVVS